MPWKEPAGSPTTLNRCADNWATVTNLANSNNKVIRPTRINRDSKANRVSKDRRVGKDNKDSNKAPGKGNKGNKGNRDNKDNNKVSRDSKDNNKVSRDSKDNNKVSRDSKDNRGNRGNRPMDRAAATDKLPTGKAIEPTGAAARLRGMTAASSAPSCAKVCARSKTYAATWAGIAIWRPASIRRFKVCGAPTTRSCATTWRPRCY